MKYASELKICASVSEHNLVGVLFHADNSITAVNNSLSALKATVGKSYRCVAEESVWISSNASVNIFNVQVQAFKIPGDKFGLGEIYRALLIGS